MGIQLGKFVIRNGELEGRKFRLEAGAKITLGRDQADFTFPDKRMSRKHCSLESREDGDHVIDLGSTNGTWVNNQRVREAMLAEGDLVRVGFTELEYLGFPEPTTSVLPHLEGAGGFNPNQTIAFRAPKLAPPRRRGRDRGKSSLQAAKSAAMGKNVSDPTKRFISAKGKF